MPRHNVALHLPAPLPAPPIDPRPSPSPLQQVVQSTLQTTDYDLVSLPLSNQKWQDRWEKLCLHPVFDEDAISQAELDKLEQERRVVDREADLWRRDGGLKREEVNISRIEEVGGVGSEGRVLAVASEWLEMDSADEGIRFDSELALKAEYAHALYLSLPTLIIPAPSPLNRAHLPSYARAIMGLLQMGGDKAVTEISVRIPVTDPMELIKDVQTGGAISPIPFNQPPPVQAQTDKKHKRLSSLSTRPQSMQAQMALFANNANQAPMPAPNVAAANQRITSGASSMMSAPLSVAGAALQAPPTRTGTTQVEEMSSTWEMWDCIRTICGYHPRLSVTLDLTNPLPPSVGALARWTAEPVRHVWLPATSFIPNAKGYPVLSKATQAFIRGMSKKNPTYILSQTTAKRHPAGGPHAYLQYVRHITNTPPAHTTPQSTSTPGHPSAHMAFPSNGVADLYAGYTDYLQAPLRPLEDDLASETYAGFEKDAVKYERYESAITQALMDLPANKKHVITVVGAGRGPLVDCALRALLHASRQATIYAVEKNPSAFLTLQERKELEWRDKVNIVFSDMRSVDVKEAGSRVGDAVELCDLLVSELLGSFGDNEGSPECLDGAMRLLKPTGISIPTSYTAHIAPISTTILHQATHGQYTKPGTSETPHVVMMSQVNLISGDNNVPGVSWRCGERVQQCWQFVHPRRDIAVDTKGLPLTNSHNTRASTHTFHIPHASTLHGLAGYFEAHLYGDIGLSIHPDNAHVVSPDLFSWFPLFFPLKEPVYLPSGSELVVNVWRMGDGRGKRVWYEWSVEGYLPVVQAAVSAPGSASLGGGQRAASGASGVMGGGQPSPLMDAQFSPGLGGRSTGGVGEMGRVKISQSSLHNAGGVHSWVSL
ncbi:hypothetical protein B9479_001699 [Cryptococcus floricola]|uniref:Protein arginine N-methyltransferase n=1 Tax=Cryptococcus floricola TaxID=2591691 RepID=A0A5D3B1J5_9TREE|nr:hypothetical protein B9479_001699 [Cryptococcus floricola]